MRPKKNRPRTIPFELYMPTHYKWEWFWEEIREVFLTPKSPRVIAMENLILELRSQNPNFTIDDILELMKRNNISPDLIKWIIEIENPWEEFVDWLMEYIIAQNPELTKDEIKKRMKEWMK